jgi:hypothetical protein
VATGGIEGCHDVAVDTGYRVIAHEIRVHAQQIEKEAAESHDDPTQADEAHLLRVAQGVSKGLPFFFQHISDFQLGLTNVPLFANLREISIRILIYEEKYPY